MDEKSYRKIKEASKTYYRSLASVICPALHETVYFTSNGFNHIMFKRAQQARDRGSQITRFKLLSLAYKLIGLTTTYQEYEWFNRREN